MEPNTGMEQTHICIQQLFENYCAKKKGVTGKDSNHRRQIQGLWARSGPPPGFIQPGTCFYPAAALSSRLTVKE